MEGGKNSASSTKVVVEAFDVILSKVATSLDFNKDQLFRASVFDPMFCTDWNINGIASTEEVFGLI